MNVLKNTTSESNGRTFADPADSSAYSLEDVKEGEYNFVSTPVENTPFTIVGKPDSGNPEWAIHWGPYRLCTPKATYEEAKNALETEKWNIIAALAISLIHETLERGDVLAENQNNG